MQVLELVGPQLIVVAIGAGSIGDEIIGDRIGDVGAMLVTSSSVTVVCVSLFARMLVGALVSSFVGGGVVSIGVGKLVSWVVCGNVGWSGGVVDGVGGVCAFVRRSVGWGVVGGVGDGGVCTLVRRSVGWSVDHFA